MNQAPRELPLPLRIWSDTVREREFRGRARVTRTLVERLISPEVAYRTYAGFALQIDPADLYHALMISGLYDPRGLDVVRTVSTPGSIALDLGANIGYFALAAAHAVGPTGEVHCFEADPRAASLLRHQAALNRFDWIRTNDVAVGSVEGGELEFHLTDQLGWSSLNPDAVAGASRTVTVPATTVDRYVADTGIDPARISFIKIDVEGVELEAIEGARDTLASGTPAVMLEVFPDRLAKLGHSETAIGDLMGSLGYEAHLPLRAPNGVRFREAPPLRASGDLVFLKR